MTRPNHTSSQQHQASCYTSRQSHTPRAQMGGSSASADSPDLALTDYTLCRTI